MPPAIIVRRADQLRHLLDRDTFTGLLNSLRYGGMSPAEIFAEIALGDLDRRSFLNPKGTTEVGGTSWRPVAVERWDPCPGISKVTTCWECERTTTRPVTVTLEVPAGRLGPFALCPRCHRTRYLPLIVEAPADEASPNPSRLEQ